MRVDMDIPPAAVTSFGPYCLDGRSRKLLKNGAPVPLTARAFDTLEVLVSHAGQTVSKEHLLKQVWRDTFVQEETLTQNISTIRRALEDTTDSPRYIATIPREGYRFVAPIQLLPETTTASPDQPSLAKATRPSRWRFVAVIASSALLVAALLLVRWPQRSTDVTPVRFELFEPEGTRFTTSGGTFGLSPDGTRLAFIATGKDGEDRLWVRSLDALESIPLKGTEGAAQPFWSPDSQAIAFYTDKALRKVKLDGSMPQLISPLDVNNALAGTWGKNGDILFAIGGKGIFRVSANGGTPALVPLPSVAADSKFLMWPHFLPDGNRFLFVAVTASEGRGVYAASLDGRTPTKHVVDARSSAAYSSGYLLYWRVGGLVAQRFDETTMTVGGDPMPIAESVAYNMGTGRAAFAVSQTSLVAYREPLQARLTWINRAGVVVNPGPTGSFESFAVAPDGRRIIAAQLNVREGTHDLWMFDAEDAEAVRVTFDPASEIRPLWSPDGSQVVFARETLSEWRIDRRNLATGVEDSLVRNSNRVLPLSWRDGAVIFSGFGRSEFAGFWSVRPGSAEAPLRLWGDQALLMSELRVSPNGRFVAFTWNEKDSRPGRGALYLSPFESPESFVQVASVAHQPRWRRDSRELFFIAPGGTLRSTPVLEGGHRLQTRTLCKTGALEGSGLVGQTYDVAPDGNTIVVKVPARPASVIVRSGWLPARR